MNYAIIATGGKQYQVSVGQEILVDKLDGEKGKSYTFDQVLLIRNDDGISIGRPYVDGGKVKGLLLDEVKGDKITISKFKAKVHYRRRMGFRPLYSKLKIESISVNGKELKKEVKVSAPKKEKTKAS